MMPHFSAVPRSLRIVLCLSLLLRLPAQGAQTTRRLAPPAPPSPRALVKSIVVGGRDVNEADSAQLTRAGATAASAVTTGLALYTGDTIQTLAGTRVTVLFLDPPVTERDNEVIINSDSRVSISSTYSWWGTIWVKVKGAFDSRTRYVQLSASGTEYEFRVEKGVDRSDVVVLEGGVEVSKDSYATRASAARDWPEWESPAWSDALLTLASYAPAAQEQYGRALTVRAGEVENYDYTFHIENRCARAHHFNLHKSEGADWLNVKAADNINISPHRDEPVRATVTIDATRLQAGAYRGRIYSECVDCGSEPRCSLAQLEWPISLTVTGTPTPTPTVTPTITPTPTPTSTTFIVRELEEATLTKGADRPAPATDERVLATLSWTNDVILSSQPTYHAQNLLPHFDTVEERSQSFRGARRSAVLERDRPGSNKTLGDVYSDWGQGAQAVRVYERERKVNPTRNATPDFIADLGEAYRQTGQLDTAKTTLDAASQSGRGTVRLFNARGNLSLDRARVALDRQNAAEARDHLAQARDAYGAVNKQTQAGLPGGGASGVAAVQTNLSETYLLAGELSLRERNAGEAKSHFDKSAELLRAAQQSDPFAPTDLGRAFQGLGDAARLEGNTTEANANYARAEEQHRQALARHRDMAEAYFNLGDLFEDRGDYEAAKKNYWQAVRYRPEQPDAYYPLAVLLQDENPQLAAELAATFLQLLPEVFKQGERATNARRILQGEKVQPKERPRPTGTGSQSDRDLVVVPDVVKMSKADAVRAIEGAGLVVGGVEQRGGAKSSDPVGEQRPAAGAKVSRGAAVELVLLPAPKSGTVKVPDVDNDSEEKARRRIEERGLTVGQVIYQPSCESVGKVLGHKPKSGTKVESGSSVDLTVGSLGENPVTLPDWVGQSRASVEGEIRSAGLKVGRVREVLSEAVTAGSVVTQEPAPGTQLAGDCKVKLTIAVEPVVVGNYVGLESGEALTRLRDAGLTGVTWERASQGPPGRVLEQSESPGAKVAKGSMVILYVSVAHPPEDVQVPPVVGMDVAKAKAILSAAGLKSTVEEEKVYNEDYEKGKVVKQAPAAGLIVPIGTAVKLTVSKGPAPIIIYED
jgi:beta-lactam-binding protein with PASTA domain/tetratricopeptide (TPR) repeat protein